jgi:uncharacterized protein
MFEGCTMRRLFRLVAFIIAVAWAAPVLAWLAPVPPFSSHLVDTAGMLEAEDADMLERMLASYQAATRGQIAVLLVKSTAPETVEQFSIRVVEEWKPGRKGVDDGVLLLVARDNPPSLGRMRIETGRGVQGELTDAQSKRVMQDVMAPHFRAAHYFKGLEAGIDAIARVLHPELLRTRTGNPAPPQIADPADSPSVASAPLPVASADAVMAAGKREADDTGKVLLIVLGVLGVIFFLVGLAFSALFTKGGRDRISNGKFPEAILMLLLYVFVSGDSEKKSGSHSGGRARSKRGSGNFDGGGASGNW